MAIYISIKQITDESDFADYSFSNSENRMGRLRLDKKTGETKLIEAHPFDNGEGFYQRAAYKIKKQWEIGELPKETCWAS